MAGTPMPKRPLPWFLFGSAIFLYLLFFAPLRTPIYLPGDVSVYLLNAQRILHGEVMYKDFFQFTPPGTELVYLSLFRLLGPCIWIPNVMLFVLGLALSWLSVAISRKVMSGWAVFLPGLLFLTCAFFSFLDATHHWYSVLAVMTAVAVVIERRTPPRLAAVGVLCGFASFFTQARGLLGLVGFAIFLVWEHRRKNTKGLLKDEVCLVSPFLTTVVATNAYFVWKAGLARFFWCIVTFGVRYYPAEPFNTYQTYLSNPPPLRPWYALPLLLVYLSIHILVPATYLLFLVRYRKQAKVHLDLPWDRLMLVNLTGLLMFISIAPAPGFYRLCAVSLPAWITLAWLLTLPGKPERALTVLAWAFGFLMTVLDPVKVQRHAQIRVHLPSGSAAFSDASLCERYQWIAEHTRPGEFFFEADWADIYVALGLRNPAPVPFVTNTGYTTPEQVQEVVEALQTHPVRLVLWSPDVDIPQRGVPLSSDHLHPLRMYLRNYYHIVKTFSGDEQIWRRDP